MANVIGIFDDGSQAHAAVEQMVNAGIDRDQISLVGRDADHMTRRIRRSGDPGADRCRQPASQARGLIGVLTDMGVPEDEAKHYENQIREGKVLITVRADNDTEAERASNMMDVQGAVDVEGGTPHDSPEATPEYEGARSHDTINTPAESTRTDPGDSLSGPEFDGTRSAPAIEPRVRVYRRVSDKP